MRRRSFNLNRRSSRMQMARGVRGRVHLKWIRGSYNKHSRKTIITHPDSAAPSRHRAVGKKTYALRERGGPARQQLTPARALVNVMLQLVWRRLRGFASQPAPPHPHSHPLALRSANKNVFVQMNRQGCSSTFQGVVYEGHAVCLQVLLLRRKGPREKAIPWLRRQARGVWVGGGENLKQDVCFRF